MKNEIPSNWVPLYIVLDLRGIQQGKSENIKKKIFRNGKCFIILETTSSLKGFSDQFY